MLPRAALPLSIRFYLCMVIFRILAFCDEERPVIYNCEFDRCTLGKSLFQNDKPSLPLSLVRLSLSHSHCFSLSLSFRRRICCVVCCAAPILLVSSTIYMMENPTVPCMRPRHPPPCNYIQVRGQQSPTFHTKTYDALCVL